MHVSLEIDLDDSDGRGFYEDAPPGFASLNGPVKFECPKGGRCHLGEERQYLALLGTKVRSVATFDRDDAARFDAIHEKGRNAPSLNVPECKILRPESRKVADGRFVSWSGLLGDAAALGDGVNRLAQSMLVSDQRPISIKDAAGALGESPKYLALVLQSGNRDGRSDELVKLTRDFLCVTYRLTSVAVKYGPLNGG
jgi:hypothetical protein